MARSAATDTAGSAPIFLISERFGQSGGGEAMKGQQFADYLLDRGHDFLVFTHARAVYGQGAELPETLLRLVDETPFQAFLWRSRVLRPLLGTYFHLRVRRMILKEVGRLAKGTPKPILHYISPVSPVELRFPPRGYFTVMGPLTGNIYYPPAFHHRMSIGDRLRERLHVVSQRLFGIVFGEKRRVDAVLVSGYERTHASLRLAGCPDDRILDVVDSGVSEQVFARPRLAHAGQNPRFMCSGRLVDHKGIDLAIKAVAQADPEITLDIYGDGVKRAELEALSRSLGVDGRVTFHGWIERHEDLMAAYGDYRGYLFPSLVEANGIVMQEAMTIGLPVVALRWGGPAMLADDDSAIYVDPSNEAQVTAEIAAAMNRLAKDGAWADEISSNARAIADQHFRWDSVVTSWQAAYQGYPGHGHQGDAPST